MGKRALLIWQAAFPWEVRLGKMAFAFRDAGYEVAILCRALGAQPPEELYQGIRIVRVGGTTAKRARVANLNRAVSVPLWFNPLWASALNTLASNFMPDLLVVRDIPLAILTARIARRFKCPMVLDMAEHYPEAMRSWDKYARNPISRAVVFDLQVPDRVERAAVLASDAIIVVCEEQKERLVREYRFPRERIEVVLNTPDLDELAMIPRGASSDQRCTFGYHGILCNDRDLETVVKGFELVAGRRPAFRLLLCGDGESEARLRSMRDASPFASRIELTGRYTRVSLPSLYARTDFGIVSLRVNNFTQHTLGNKCFDYAALGKPFIFTRVRPLENAVRDLQCGVPFEGGSPESVAAAMEELSAADYAMLSNSGISGVKRRFNWPVDRAKLLAFVSRWIPTV